MNLEFASHNRSDWPVEAWEAAELLDSGTTLRRGRGNRPPLSGPAQYGALE